MTPLTTIRETAVTRVSYEEAYLAPCLHALLAQSRPADEIILVDNASTDRTASLARAIPGVRVVHEPRKGLVHAREAGRRAASGDILAYLDADCRAPFRWLERVTGQFARARPPIRRRNALSIACHPHHRTTRRIEISTCYLWDNRKELADLVDVCEAANRDDLFSVTSLKHYRYVASSDFHKAKHLYSWKTLLKCEKSWPEVKRALRTNVDVGLVLYRDRGDDA